MINHFVERRHLSGLDIQDVQVVLRPIYNSKGIGDIGRANWFMAVIFLFFFVVSSDLHFFDSLKICSVDL